MRSQFVFSEMWIGLRRNLTMTMALIVVVAISLSLLGTGFLFVKQVDRARLFWQGKVEMSVYFCIKSSPNPVCEGNGAASPGDGSTLEQRLKSMPQVQYAVYQSQSAELRELPAGILERAEPGQDTQNGTSRIRLRSS